MLHPLHKSDLWNVESTKLTRACIRFPIFDCLLEFWMVFN